MYILGSDTCLCYNKAELVQINRKLAYAVRDSIVSGQRLVIINDLNDKVKLVTDKYNACSTEINLTNTEKNNALVAEAKINDKLNKTIKWGSYGIVAASTIIIIETLVILIK